MNVEAIVRTELVRQKAVGLISFPHNTESCKCHITSKCFMDCPRVTEDEAVDIDFRHIARNCQPFWEDEDGIIRVTRKNFWRKATQKELAQKNKCVLE